MSTNETPILSLPYILAAQAQKHVPHNEAIRALDAVVQIGVLDRDLAAPPATPAEGDRYIVAASPTGAWAGHAGEIAAFQDDAWMFYAPRAGWLAWVTDEALLLTFDAGLWQPALRTVPLLGINATADATNRLAVSSSAILFNHAGAGIQEKFNKNAAGDTASLLFQTNWSGRAEIGTTGDDNLHVKVSADGSSWKEAMVVDAATGAATFACGSGQMLVDIFTASGTWTKPAWARSVEIWAIGGGGGGGAGRRGASGSARASGGGGAAGGLVWDTFAASELGATLSVTIGAGGSGAAAAMSNDTSGAAGSPGGATSISDGAALLLTATGGNGGGAGTAANGAASTGGTTVASTANPGGAGLATASGGSGSSVAFSRGAGGGGAGGGISSADTRLGPGAGGNGYHIGGAGRIASGGAGGPTPGASGSAGTAKTWDRGAGGGGGGGNSGSTAGTVAGGSGGDGGAPGGGGGGGGAGTNGANGGAGGDGGRGEVWIISHS